MRIGGAGILFGTNGVRGIANEELTAEMALNLGRTIATLKEGKIAVACDTRISSQMLKCAVAAGIMSCGSDVVDLKVAPTPALQFYVKNTDCTAGVIVTASHNPKEYNGIKFIQENGVEFFREMDEECERIYMSKSFKKVDWRKVGSIVQDDCIEMYVDAVTNVELDKKYRVVADCGNGAASFTTPEILKRLGCDCLVINANPDGRFPAREPEPVEQNLSILKKLVVDFKADFGVAHDGDGDRAVFIDEKGNFVSEDVVLALMAKYYVEKNKGGIVVTPVSTSKVVEDAVKEAGGEVVYTAVGSPVVAKVMIEKKAVFGGEGNGGLIFPEHLVARDGGMSIAKMLQILDETGKSLSELVAEFPKYFTIKGKVPCKDKIKLLEKLKEEFPNANHVDGARIDFEDGWILIRPSGTEPIARIYAEGKSRRRAEELYEFGLNFVKKVLS